MKPSHDGPMKPPQMDIVLIIAIPTAADFPLRNVVGSDQTEGWVAIPNMKKRANAESTRPDPARVPNALARYTPVNPLVEASVWRYRSRWRSECHPLNN